MTSTTRRSLRAFMYSLLIAAGALYVVWPSPSLASQIDWRTYVWSGFLVVGGTSGLYASITRKFIGEYFGIPLLVTAFVVFGIATMFASGGAQARIILGLVLLAFAAGLQTRWQEVRSINITGRKRRPNDPIASRDR